MARMGPKIARHTRTSSARKIAQLFPSEKKGKRSTPAAQSHLVEPSSALVIPGLISKQILDAIACRERQALAEDLGVHKIIIISESKQVVCDIEEEKGGINVSVIHEITSRRKDFEQCNFSSSLLRSNSDAFRVIWLASWGCNLAVRVFSSSTGQWRAAAYEACSDEVIGGDPLCFRRRHFAGGCIYWDSVLKQKKLLVLDTRTMEFSIADFPPGEWGDQKIAIIDAGEGRVGMFGIRDGDVGVESVLNYMVWQNECDSSGQLKKISLGYGYLHFITAATKKYLILLRLESRQLIAGTPRKIDFVSLDVKTMQLERMFAGTFGFGRSKAHIYTNFPPSLLSSPTI